MWYAHEFGVGFVTVVECFSDPQGTEEEILAATYRSLVTHGYADVTIKRIGDELDKSPSLVYHHYENKDALVLACLEYMLDCYAESMTETDLENASEHLEDFLEWLTTAFDDEDGASFLALLIDLRSRAIHEDGYRDHFTRSDEIFRSHFGDIVATADADGDIQIPDPDVATEVLFTLLIGFMVRGSTTSNTGWTEDIRTGMQHFFSLE